MATNKQFFILFLTLFGFASTYCAYGQNAEIIINEDYYNEGGSRFSTIDPLAGKTITRRAMQSRGIFEYDLSGNMPDSLKKAIEVAVDIWSDYLNSYGTDHSYLTITPEETSVLRRVTPRESKPTLEKPQLVSLDFTYDSFDFDELYFRNCKTKLRFYCPGADYLSVYMFFDGDYFPYYSHGREHTSPDVIEFEFEGDDLWNTHYQAMSMKENGEYSDKSDLYYLKDYAKISDPAILEALGITGIEESYLDDEKPISLANGRLCAALSPEEVVSMRLFSPNGKVVKTSFDNSMDVTQLPKGLYILSINCKNNKSLKKKIIL